jgi:uncharacterized protein (TIGR03083 family)
MNHDEWLDIAEREYAQFLGLLRSLDPAEWQAPTDCAGWTVRDIVAHVVGAAQSTARVRESGRQMLLSRRHEGEQLIDRINEVQLAERRSASPDALMAELSDAAQRSVRARRRLPRLVRRVPVPTDTPGLGTTTLGYLNDTVYTRDVWMHRIDISRATARHMELTADHDGHLVADAATEWLSKSSTVTGLVLTGPAGGVFGTATSDAPTFDAVEFCRALSGRTELGSVRSDLVAF